VLHGVQRDCSGKAGHTTGFTGEQHLLKCGGGGIVGELIFGVVFDWAAAVLVWVGSNVFCFLNLDCFCWDSTFSLWAPRGSM
jgi:hypothetical protein